MGKEMKNYPKMLPEIVEAVHLTYEDNPPLETDCMLYLYDVLNMANVDDEIVVDYFDQRHLCVKCGNNLDIHRGKEYHPECGIGAYEVYNEEYCPECDGFNKEEE